MRFAVSAAKHRRHEARSRLSAEVAAGAGVLADQWWPGMGRAPACSGLVPFRPVRTKGRSQRRAANPLPGRQMSRSNAQDRSDNPGARRGPAGMGSKRLRIAAVL